MKLYTFGEIVRLGLVQTRTGTEKSKGNLARTFARHGIKLTKVQTKYGKAYGVSKADIKKLNARYL